MKQKIHNVECLNLNLQDRCYGLRCAWDGSCGKIYYDFENNYNTIDINRKYQSDDIVSVILNTNKMTVQWCF